MSTNLNIQYIKCDVLVIKDKSKPTYILHVVNNLGKWGAGFVLALSDKWSEPENIYRSRKNWPLGEIDICKINDKLYVVNMICQKGIRQKYDKKDKQYICYDNLKICLEKVKHMLSDINECNIRMPRIGCGLGGGKWQDIEPIIVNVFNDPLFSNKTNIYVCDL